MNRFFTLLLMVIFIKGFGQISSYQKFFSYFQKEKNTHIILRKFQLNDAKNHYFAVEANSLKTVLIHGGHFREIPLQQLRKRFGNSQYFKVLKFSDALFSGLQDNGIKSLQGNYGFAVTTDLCPSTKNLEFNFYNHLPQMVSGKKSVPVTVFLSGLWLKKHQPELRKLLELQSKKQISITWGNHSYTHPYHPKLPMDRNFLLSSDHLENEILDTEKEMLKNAILPSVYFRFPGLVSNRQTFDFVKSFGLIVVNTDSWLAKNQFPQDGSIALLHGNGNEPEGIIKFSDWAKGKNEEKLEPL